MSEYKIRTSFLFKLSILWQFVLCNFRKNESKDYTEERHYNGINPSHVESGMSIAVHPAPTMVYMNYVRQVSKCRCDTGNTSA